jgi:glycerol-3-phosphate dehydrogenase subunit C
MTDQPPPKDASREGSLEPPMRHPLDWRSEGFYDQAAIETEMERVFDICHTCRRCFNLCDSFPILFDLVDERRAPPANSTGSRRPTSRRSSTPARFATCAS